jgi:hypothetical protein
MANTPSRAAQFQKLCKQVARELNCRPTDERAQHVATLRMARQTIAARLVSGVSVDPDALLKIDTALRHYAPREEVKVSVDFVEGVTGLFDCPHCGKRSEAKNYVAPEPPPSSPSPPTSPPPTETAKPSLPAPSPNIVPIRRDGSVHDVAFPSGGVAPLKRHQNEPWRGHVLPNLNGGGSASNPFSAGPAPNFSAPVLPSPFDRGRS